MSEMNNSFSLPLSTFVLWKQFFTSGELFGILNHIFIILQLIYLHRNHCIFHGNSLMLINCRRKRIGGSQVLKL